MIFIPHAKKFQKDHSDIGLMDVSFDQLDQMKLAESLAFETWGYGILYVKERVQAYKRALDMRAELINVFITHKLAK